MSTTIERARQDERPRSRQAVGVNAVGLSQETSPASRTSAFMVLWAGQAVSMFGSSLTGFALGVWVYQTTGSVTRFALIAFFTTLPGVVLLPLAGLVADRYDRRRVMILSDTCAALGTLAIAALLWRDALEIWHIYVLMSVISAANAPQHLAFTASIPMLVEKRQLGRANGLAQLGGALAEIGAPLLAGILVVTMPLEGILTIDVTSFVFAATTLLLIRIPDHRAGAAQGERSSGPAAEPFLERLLVGWRFIRARPGLTGLVLYFTALNFSRGAVLVLITPLVLSIASPPVLGRVLSLAAAGMLVGGIVMTAWGGPRRRMDGIYGATLLYAVMLCLGGLRPSIPLISVAAFLLISTGPMINGSVQAIWQSKVPFELQGRVNATRRMFSWGATPLAYLVSGPLADHVFEPLMAEGGALASAFGPVFGTGPGRGVGLFMTLLGLSTLLTLSAGFVYPRLRRLEKELPDADSAVKAEGAGDLKEKHTPDDDDKVRDD